MECFAPCAAGLSGLLADELRSFGAARVRPLPSGVAFFCADDAVVEHPLAAAYRALLWSRVASRVLLILARGEAQSQECDADSLYALAHGIAWEQHFADDTQLAIEVDGSTDALRDTRFTALRVKDAINDRLREVSGAAIHLVAREDAEVFVSVSLKGRRVRVALDLAGESLHKRGYRVPSAAIEAPLRETLAAGMLLMAGWGGIASATGATPHATLLDPLCGSGTIAIEAALLAADRAPGLLRSQWGHERWLGHDEALWSDLLAEADDRAEAGCARLTRLQEERGHTLVSASDIDAAAIEVARASAKRAGVADCIDFKTADLAHLTAGSSTHTHPQPPQTPFLVVTNPPYGKRLASRSQLPALYAALQHLAAQAAASDQPASAQAGTQQQERTALCLITADTDVDHFLGATASTTLPTYNGPIEASIRLYDAAAWTPAQPADTAANDGRTPGLRPISAENSPLDCFPDAPKPPPAPQTPPPLFTDGKHSQFAARLAKMARHRAKWARRAGVTCYRVYDGDLPDYQVAIDLYAGAAKTRDEGTRWAVVAEYAAPKNIDPALAAERLRGILTLTPQILGLPSDCIFFKQRRRDKGGSQYADDAKQAGANAGERVQASNSARATTTTPRPRTRHVVEEDGLHFTVDFDGYLDTGLFLDHRPVRAYLRAASAGKRCLNLFAYTGSASVFMGAGGAQSVHTVDLSHTYLERARDNMARNRLKDPTRYTFEQADVLTWAAEHRHDTTKYDLIFVDPPTFSNSKRMRTRSWDVQRDHAELLIALSRMLEVDGRIVFSTNLTSFTPDAETLTKARVELKDISKQTIPPDFERKGKPIHHCYVARRVG